MCVFEYVYESVCACESVSVCECIYMCVFESVYESVPESVCACVCVCMHECTVRPWCACGYQDSIGESIIFFLVVEPGT